MGFYEKLCPPPNPLTLPPSLPPTPQKWSNHLFASQFTMVRKMQFHIADLKKITLKAIILQSLISAAQPIITSCKCFACPLVRFYIVNKKKRKWKKTETFLSIVNLNGLFMPRSEKKTVSFILTTISFVVLPLN